MKFADTSIFVLTLSGLIYFTTALSQGQIDRALRAHNTLRALHGAPYLSWDNQLAEGAQRWAEHLASIDKLSHDESISEGENLYYKGGPEAGTVEDATLSWYNEIDDYSYTTTRSENTKPIGHFTQVVWESSAKLGVGIATKRNGDLVKTYIAARYSPRGNYVMINFGESYEAARKRIYGKEVRPKKPGAVTPTIYELNPALCKDGLNGQCGLYARYFTCGKSYVKKNCPSICKVC